MTQFDNLSFSRFKIRFQVRKTVELDLYPGSTIRGIFGHALREVHYGMKDAECVKCENSAECQSGNLPGYMLLTPRNHPIVRDTVEMTTYRLNEYPGPLVIIPPMGGVYTANDELSFKLVVIGRGLRYLPFIKCALEKMTAFPWGRGRGRGRTRFSSMETDWYRLGEWKGDETVAAALKTPHRIFKMSDFLEWGRDMVGALNPNTIRIRFLTPFRYKINEKLGGRKPDFQLFMRNVFRRLDLLKIHTPWNMSADLKKLLGNAQNIQTVKSDLNWYIWQRYSSRQNKKMNFDGYIGPIVFSGGIGDFLPYIKICESLHVGKQTMFGLGRYELSLL